MKQLQTPEFQVIRQDEANAKFFVASFDAPGSTGATSPAVTQYTTGSTNGWF